MAIIPAKTRVRLIAGIKKYQPIVAAARSKDLNESDTVTIITDMLADVLGYAKYTEITSEYAVKKTFCDLAIRMGDTVKLLIEVKAAAITLKDNHIRQAVDYGSNDGIDWIILTNGTEWHVFRVIFGKPICHDLVYSFDFTKISAKKETDLELLYLISKESISKVSKDSLSEFHALKQTVNKYTVGQILMTDVVLDAVRKALKKVSPDAKITNTDILEIINNEVLKREVLDDEKAAEARKKVTKAMKSAPVKKIAKEIEPADAEG